MGIKQERFNIKNKKEQIAIIAKTSNDLHREAFEKSLSLISTFVWAVTARDKEF